MSLQVIHARKISEFVAVLKEALRKNGFMREITVAVRADPERPSVVLYEDTVFESPVGLVARLTYDLDTGRLTFKVYPKREGVSGYHG